MRRLVATTATLALLAAPVLAQPAVEGQAQGETVDGGSVQSGPMQSQSRPTGARRMPMEGSMHRAQMHRLGMHHADRGTASSMDEMGAVPTQPGQGAFGAVQEVVRILEADPATDWSKVSLDALREHLIDMEEVTLHADAAVQHMDDGIQVAVTGQGRTLDAIRRMVPADARHLNGQNGWTVRTTDLPNGVMLIATSNDPKQATIIRGLGFIGVLASGNYHQEHHLMVARGRHM
jgi:hypothetical protein